ncbi:hypothetical protein JMJ77_0014343 [Colletotrichum scovillei]|uniref:Uncharacterized protein n=1 Tax=Colletotrichum scovillei TaxID=1209932 RepID=A0A9P7R6L4_9PEZI|nr:hypothetical protein JMJ77_0014343 [Colletotrichum scovillei]KAG7065872.1 hypothetical protein JMJ78_0012616 [Colletotrichum scovillei]KAG7068476.1 hypothetical protein JMJ76_0008163 [Colletotrichum scovillei]
MTPRAADLFSVGPSYVFGLHYFRNVIAWSHQETQLVFMSVSVQSCETNISVRKPVRQWAQEAVGKWTRK